MPVPFLFIAALSGLLIGAAAVIFWDKVVEWAQDAVFPWFQQNFPSLEQHVRNAFAKIDRVVAAIRKTAIAAWRRIRPFLLKQVIKWERKASGEYTYKVIQWLRSKLEDHQVVERVVERTVPMDDLPADVRASLLKGASSYSIDFTGARDQEIQQAADELELAM